MNSFAIQKLLSFILLIVVLLLSSNVSAFSSVFGIGALLFRPPGTKTLPSLGEVESLTEAADFFTDAFWNNKVGGGIKVLKQTQRKSLLGSQINEFKKRYGSGRYGNRDRTTSELVICRNGKNEVMGCCGVEVDVIYEDRLNGLRTKSPAPLMSNLAVGNKFRRKGIAEELVREVEDMVRKKWGYEEIYLYVEKRNRSAVKLYSKMGYRQFWEDDTAATLLPMKGGSMRSVQTT
eukprot:CAMPEP_0194143124 /NCGR_PEP_ID=MMETSP0152-20130528/12322_1 /TAXON_ID=1049557 /ORGANISM="Thalassiothrix antarctica, Strain L6-D1" /LENGTH=233 /DNA_ID=CAMNT_0038842389 /DNA_START=191 /DNA_END=888 /DNA_ORIENTATION=+